MGNRAEVSLSNPSLFSDVTAWRAIRNVDRGLKQPNFEQARPNIIFSREQPHVAKSKYPQAVRITELNQQLASLRIQKQEGQISNKDYREQQQALAKKLHEEMERRGHKPIRKKQ